MIGYIRHAGVRGWLTCPSQGRMQGCMPNSFRCQESVHFLFRNIPIMNSARLDPRNIANNTFGDNSTIYQGNIQNTVTDQKDQCLKDLRPTDPRDDKTRIQQTKGGLLKESYNWILRIRPSNSGMIMSKIQL